MTLTFNPSKYSELLAQHQPKLIKTEAENDRALALVEHLMHQADRTPEEDELYELLITLIEKFEHAYYQPGQYTTPQSLILFLMEQRDLKPKDLSPIFGTEALTQQVLTNQIDLNRTQIKALGQFFQVDPSLFL